MPNSGKKGSRGNTPSKADSEAETGGESPAPSSFEDIEAALQAHASNAAAFQKGLDELRELQQVEKAERISREEEVTRRIEATASDMRKAAADLKDRS